MPTWNRYRVVIRFEDRLVGGIPIVPEGAGRADAYESWARGQLTKARMVVDDQHPRGQIRIVTGACSGASLNPSQLQGCP
jgi:hypothetical protein